MTNVTASTQIASSELGKGTVLGSRFEVRQKIGSDGFGRLYLASDNKTGREVSLRQVRGHLVTPEVSSTLRKEVKAGAAIKHTNVHRVFGLTSAPDRSPVLVQDPVSGRNLADYAKRQAEKGSPLTVRGAYNVVAHLSNGLEALHALGPHGAVRPSVAWISSDGRVSLMDFAVARAVMSGLTLSKLAEGELKFLAPEVQTGEEATIRSDVFGLGALLYVLLTGRSPGEDFIKPSQASKEASPDLDKELLRALSREPAARHESPAALRDALLPLMGGLEEASSEDFGVDIDVEVNLASIRPSMRPGSVAAAVAANIPKAAPIPSITGGDPQAGMRVSIHEQFRESEVDIKAQSAAEARKSMGAVNLQDVLTKITENDDARWMLVKTGMDHGPFTGKQLVNMIIKGEALAEHGLLNMDTGERRKVKEFDEFDEFLGQYELRRKEAQHKAALQHAETAERRSTLFKVSVGAAIVAVLGMAGGGYLLSRRAAEQAQRDESLGDLYKRGEIELSGSAGILPAPKRRRGGRRGGGGGGSGSGLSYEQAMMEAVDLGNVESSGGEKQLSRSTIQGVMNKRLGGIYGGCVKGSAGKVTIDMAILGNGAVRGVSVRGGNAGLQACVANKVRRVRFPRFSAPRMGARFSFDT